MTQKEIDEMTGDEVDEYLATKVHGWMWDGVDGGKAWGHWTDPKEKADAKASVGFPDGHSWSPSWCLDDAMEAVKVVGLDYLDHDESRVFCLRWSYGKWMAGWHHSDLVVKWKHVGCAEAPARAVCNAVIAFNEKL